MNTSEKDEAIQQETIAGFLLLTFNQPDIRNPLGPNVVAALSSAIDQASLDPSIRAVVLRGYGSVFSAGGNLGNFQERLAAPVIGGRNQRSAAARLGLSRIGRS